VSNFLEDHRYVHTVWYRTTKLSTITWGGQVSRESAIFLIPRGGAPVPPPPKKKRNLGPTMPTWYDKQQTKFAWWSKYMRGKFFRLDHAPFFWPEIFATQMLTSDLFVVANVRVLILFEMNPFQVTWIDALFMHLIWHRHCWLGGKKACKKLGVGLLMVMIWLELYTSYSSSCHHYFQQNPDWRHSGIG